MRITYRSSQKWNGCLEYYDVEMLESFRDIPAGTKFTTVDIDMSNISLGIKIEFWEKGEKKFEYKDVILA